MMDSVQLPVCNAKPSDNHGLHGRTEGFIASWLQGFWGLIRAPRRAAPQVVVAGKHAVAMRAVELDVSTIPLPNV
jgi:hypothetical protein